MIEITVNDEHKTLASNQTLGAVLTELGYAGQTVAVALNGQFIEQSHYGSTEITAKDCLDIIAPMQGG